MACRWKKKKKIKCKMPVKNGVRIWWEDLHLTSPASPSSRGTSPSGWGWFKLGLLEIAESLARHQVGQRRLSFRRKQLSLRICTSVVLPFLCGHTCYLAKFILLLWEPCVKSTSHLFLPSLLDARPCAPFPQQLIIMQLLKLFTRSHVLGTQCSS